MQYGNMSIKEVVQKIDTGHYYLPAIQRDYVWPEDKITKYFDSLLKEYPTGTLLFWKIGKDEIVKENYQLYEIVRTFARGKNIENQIVKNVSHDVVNGVLDGQQRLTSLYVTLFGTYSTKIKNLHSNNPKAFVEKELYFNLLSNQNSANNDFFEFKFLSDSELSELENSLYWFKVSRVLNIVTKNECLDFYNRTSAEKINNSLKFSDVIKNNIEKLFEAVVERKSINYFEISDLSMDEILEIFERVNSGVVLTKSDLLMSTIIASWSEARKKIKKLIKLVNDTGAINNFRVNSDFIINSLLIMSKIDISSKSKSLKKNDVIKIKGNWTKIENSIIKTFETLSSIGINGENVQSYNSIVPLVYYFYNTRRSKPSAAELENIRKYFVLAQVKQIFGGSSSSTLNSCRERIDSGFNRKESFKIEWFYDMNISGNRSFKINEDDLERIMKMKKNNSYTYSILTILYPNLKYDSNNFHIDHIHPYVSFKKANLKPLYKNEQTWNEILEMRDRIPNLQMLSGKENTRKNDESFEEWYKKKSNRTASLYIPQNISYELINFVEFYNERKEILKNHLKLILQ